MMAAAPGSYNPDDSFVKTAQPKIGIGSSKRQPLSQAKNVPGPGAYQPKSETYSGP